MQTEETFHFKKKYGQNFIKNPQVLEQIVTKTEILPNALTIEVGPGMGVLTKQLARVSKTVLAYEIDTTLEDYLVRNLKDCPNVVVQYGDFLNASLVEDLSSFSYEHLYFVSNVPYYITTPILFKLIDSFLPFEKIVMMIQKEVGNRFRASAGTKEYSALTVLLNYYFSCKKIMDVSRNQFKPVPNVDSVVVAFEKKERAYLKDETFFRQLVHDSFQFKRKTLRNNLKKYDLAIIAEVLEPFHYDLNVRAEQLDVSVFIALANALIV